MPTKRTRSQDGYRLPEPIEMPPIYACPPRPLVALRWVFSGSLFPWGLTDIVPGIRRFEFGPDNGLEETTLDHALVIDFSSVNDWRAYREHPQHVAFANQFLPLIERVERVQYRIGPDA